MISVTCGLFGLGLVRTSSVAPGGTLLWPPRPRKFLPQGDLVYLDTPYYLHPDGILQMDQNGGW
jgi:hypothetical protein